MVGHVVSGRATIEIDVVYALPDRQAAVRLRLPSGSTVRQAVEASGLMARFPGIDLARNVFGIFGKVVSMTRVLNAGDRVEIYRPLMADPKRRRRERAAQSGRRRG